MKGRNDSSSHPHIFVPLSPLQFPSAAGTFLTSDRFLVGASSKRGEGDGVGTAWPLPMAAHGPIGSVRSVRRAESTGRGAGADAADRRATASAV